MEDNAQRFGGQWSLIKIATVAAYFKSFNLALKKKGFRRVYIDAFAGSGDFQFTSRSASPLFNEAETIQTHEGSARRALQTNPPFDQLFFIERDTKKVRALERVLSNFSHHNAQVLQGDANTEVQRLCRSTNWQNTRGVAFLDPFGNSVDWSTIKELSKTKLDIWYLFPLSGVYRNAPIDRSRLTQDKRATITKILGTPDWETRFYEPPPNKPLYQRHQVLTFIAHWRVAIEVMRWGSAMSLFQASQQASTMSS